MFLREFFGCDIRCTFPDLSELDWKAWTHWAHGFIVGAIETFKATGASLVAGLNGGVFVRQWE